MTLQNSDFFNARQERRPTRKPRNETTQKMRRQRVRVCVGAVFLSEVSGGQRNTVGCLEKLKREIETIRNIEPSL